MGKSFPLTKILQDGWNHQPVWISQMNNGYGMIYGFLQKLGVFPHSIASLIRKIDEPMMNE